MLRRGLVPAMAMATGVAVANIYYNQPLLGIIEAAFPGSPRVTGMVPTATQLGYAAGLFFLVPVGDLTDRRRLIVAQFGVLAASMAAAALAPSAGLLLAACFLLGAAATVAQQVVPFAAALAPPERRGAVVGTVMAGLLCGILFSRTLAGFVGVHGGWRAMFWLAVPLALAAGGLMAALLPRGEPLVTMGYGQALISLAHLWRKERGLRRATLVQAGMFGSFSVFWTVLALRLQGPPFYLGAEVAGLFGVVGAAGVIAAPLAGRMADRYGPALVVGLVTWLALAAWVCFGLWPTLSGMVVGVILLDFAVQASLVSNQHIVFALNPAARNRLNTVFVTGLFLGGATGSALAVLAWAYVGWTSVCVLGAAMTLSSAVIEGAGRRRAAPR